MLQLIFFKSRNGRRPPCSRNKCAHAHVQKNTTEKQGPRNTPNAHACTGYENRARHCARNKEARTTALYQSCSVYNQRPHVSCRRLHIEIEGEHRRSRDRQDICILVGKLASQFAPLLSRCMLVYEARTSRIHRPGDSVDLSSARRRVIDDGAER